MSPTGQQGPQAPERRLPVRSELGWGGFPADLKCGEVADVAVGPGDRVYALTRMDPQVMVFETNGHFLRAFGREVLKVRPHAISVGPHGTLFVACEDRHQIVEMTDHGDVIRCIGSGTPSDTGYDPGAGDLYARLSTIERVGGPFNRPTKVAFGARAMYVSDGYGNAAIHQYTLDLEYVRSWGAPGMNPGEFHLPHSLLATPDGRIVVADRENDRLQVFDADGAFLDQWTGLQRPSTVVLTPGGNILCAGLARSAGQRRFTGEPVGELHSASFALLDLEGRLLERWHTLGDGIDGTSMLAPHGLAFDSKGGLYLGQVTLTASRDAGFSMHGYLPLQKFDGSEL